MITKAYLALAVTALIAVTASYNYAYNQGRDSERAKHDALFAAEAKRQQVAYQVKVQQVLSLQAAEHQAELQRAAENLKTEVITQETIRYVEKKIVVPGECNDLAADVVGVLKQTNAVIIAAASEAQSADKPGAINLLPTAESDPRRITASTNSQCAERGNHCGLLPPPKKLSRHGDQT